MPTRLKIALIAACPFPCPRGTPIRIQRMAEALAEFGHDVHVITYHLGNKNGSYPFSIHRTPNIPFYRKTKPGPTFLKLFLLDLLLAIKIIRLNAEIKFDVIHGHHYEGLLAALPGRLFSSAPILYDAHTLLSTELHHYNIPLPGRMLNRIAIVLDKTLPKMSDHVISVSKSIQETLEPLDQTRQDWISVVPNGVEIDLFLQTESKKQGGEDLVLGYAGNFAPYQRIEILFQAFHYVIKEYPTASLELYTEDDPEGVSELIQAVGLNSAVRIFRTPFEDLPEKLAKTDILLNPRMDGAGHPLKLLNYMAAGKPIVTFSGSSHGLDHDNTAWIVVENTASSFAEGITKLIEDGETRARIGKNARRHVEEHHVWTVNANVLTKIYKDLLSR